MWKEFISSLNGQFDFSARAEQHEIAETENSLNLVLPAELSGLLSETNGLYHSTSYTDMVWSTESIQKTNLEFRENPDFAELYMPFDSLLFFGDAGDGDQFAFRILANEVRMEDVYIWNHENDSRIWIASSLRTFIEWWAAGKIEI
jgi:SMI1-KNR4 cell-wall